MNKCPQCGGSFSHSSFVCEYCGYVESNKIKRAGNSSTFEDAINIIQDNLNALHDINKPTIKNGIVAVLRVILAIYTFGLVLIFWRKPKKRFNKKSYYKLKLIVKRNINLLKISSKGDSNLLNRIKIAENELDTIDLRVKQNLKAKRLTTILTILAFIALIAINNITNPTLTHDVTTLELSVSGDLKDTLTIIPEVYEIKYHKQEHIKSIYIYVEFKAENKFVLEETEDILITLLLTDKNGDVSELFFPSELKKQRVDRIIKRLEKGKSDLHTRTKFDINTKKLLKDFPKEITNFKIITKLVEIEKDSINIL